MVGLKEAIDAEGCWRPPQPRRRRCKPTGGKNTDDREVRSRTPAPCASVRSRQRRGNLHHRAKCGYGSCGSRCQLHKQPGRPRSLEGSRGRGRRGTAAVSEGNVAGAHPHGTEAVRPARKKPGAVRRDRRLQHRIRPCLRPALRPRPGRRTPLCDDRGFPRPCEAHMDVPPISTTPGEHSANQPTFR